MALTLIIGDDDDDVLLSDDGERMGDEEMRERCEW
jgi:hypothetical protein